MTRLVQILVILVVMACGQDDAITPMAGALDPVEAAVVPADPIDAPQVRTAWIASSFGFLYAADDQSVDALDIDSIVSRADPSATEAQCPHDDFTAPDGSEGVDHQLLRLVMAFESLHAGGIADQIIDSAAKNGSMTLLMSVEDDRMRIMMGHDVPLTGNDGEVLPYGSFRPHLDSAYHSDLGPITSKDDVLMAGPADLRLRLNIQIVEADLFLRDAFVRVITAPDGTAHGVIQGYWASEDIVTVLASTDAHLGALGYTLEEFQAVLDANADRDPDSKGVCGALSAAFRFSAQPAFIVEEEMNP